MRTHWLTIERLSVDDANATAGFTYGAIPPTAFLGLVHALSRGLQAAGIGTLQGASMVCHATQVQAFRANTGSDWRFAQKRHPLKKDGSLPTIVEQGRMRSQVSLVVEAALNEDCYSSTLRQWVEANLGRMRLAGGVIETWKGVHASAVAGEADNQLAQQRRLLRRLLPGYVLIERSDLLADRYQQRLGESPEATTVDGWADFTELQTFLDVPEGSSGDATTGHQRIEQARQGWIVPVMVGYRALERPAGNIAGARAPDTPVAFCEPVHTIAEWRSPHRFDSVEEALWRHEYTPDWYLTRNRNGYVESTGSQQTYSHNTHSEIEE